MPTCPSCSAEIAAGARWCGICHANVLDAAIGSLASPGKRFGAYVLDLLAPMVALFLIFVVAGMGVATGTEEGAGLGLPLGFLLFGAYVGWAFVLFATRGTTPGKWLLGMRVVTEDGRTAGFLTMLIREWVGKVISGLILMLGFLWILLDRDKQGWHDKLMSTFVVR